MDASTFIRNVETLTYHTAQTKRKHQLANNGFEHLCFVLKAVPFYALVETLSVLQIWAP
jgi:hypothetical protein